MKEQITSRQLLYILIFIVLPTVIMFVSGIATSFADRDAWISVQVATVAAIVIVYVSAKLGMRFPNYNFGEICRLLTGPWIGFLILLYYSFWHLYIGSAILRQAGELMNTGVMRKTPLLAFLIMQMIVVVVAVYLGLEVIARSSEFLLPIIALFVVFALFLTLNLVDWTKLQPVLAEGWIPIIRGSLPSIAYRGELYMIIYFIPHLREPQKAHRMGQWAAQIIGLFLTINVVTQIAAFGAIELSRMTLPALTHAKAIEVAVVFERIEVVLIAFWIAGITMKTAIFFYVSVQLFAQLFRVGNYRALIVPTAVLYVVLSLVQYENSLELRGFIADYFFLFSLPAKLLIPLVLLIIAIVRKKGGESSAKQAG